MGEKKKIFLLFVLFFFSCATLSFFLTVKFPFYLTSLVCALFAFISVYSIFKKRDKEESRKSASMKYLLTSSLKEGLLFTFIASSIAFIILITCAIWAAPVLLHNPLYCFLFLVIWIYLFTFSSLMLLAVGNIFWRILLNSKKTSSLKMPSNTM